MLLVKVVRFRPGQLDPEPVVASADQEVARKVVELIVQSLRQKVLDEPVATVPARSRTDD
jgi:hypothetical protein